MPVRSRLNHMRMPIACAALFGAVALVFTGCGAGQVTQTSEQVSAVNGAEGHVGPISLLNVRLAYPADGGHAYEPGDSVTLLLTITNTGDRADELAQVSTQATDEVEITGATTVHPDVALMSSDEGAAEEAGAPAPSATASSEPAEPQDGGGGADAETAQLTIVLRGLTHPVRPGLPTEITFVFAQAGEVTLRVPVGEPERGRLEPSGSEPEPEHG